MPREYEILAFIVQVSFSLSVDWIPLNPIDRAEMENTDEIHAIIMR